MIGKTFWINIVVFITAILLFALNNFFQVDINFIWYGVMIVFGMYSGADGIASLVTSRQMPKGEKYTTTYHKMLTLVIFTWILFIISAVMHVVYLRLDIDINMYITTGFVTACGISGIFAGTKKLNNGMENLGGDS